MGVSELNYVQIGLRIREARNAKGWPQAELAFRAGLNSAYVSHI
jgi:transcriptional regulator with XRE-family HTH domain